MKTDDEIVLTIFGGEHCVTTLADLEEIAKAIHKKVVRESGMSANPSTLAEKIDAQISPLNAESNPSETKAPKP